jgi:hypothetical protein
MYAHLTTYDTTRHLAAACRDGAFDGRGRRQTHPIRRIRHALSALARHGEATQPTMPVIVPV